MTFLALAFPALAQEGNPGLIVPATAQGVEGICVADLDGDQFPEVISAENDSGDLAYYASGGGDQPEFTRYLIDGSILTFSKYWGMPGSE